jgi:hypothetical protein
MWGTVAVVLLVVIVAGFIYSGRNKGKLTPEQEQQAKQTIMQQYQSYYGSRGGAPANH